jgi:hypothetical protein
MNTSKINEISLSHFGHPLIALDQTSALWLAEIILERTGKNVYRRISNVRHKLGKGTSFPVAWSNLWKLICKR